MFSVLIVLILKHFTVAPIARAWTERSGYQTGSDITINCDVQGFPESRVTWYKDNNVIEPSDRVQLTGNNSLIISGAEGSDSGAYRCEAINLLGESSSIISVNVDGSLKRKKKNVPKDLKIN